MCAFSGLAIGIYYGFVWQTIVGKSALHTPDSLHNLCIEVCEGSCKSGTQALLCSSHIYIPGQAPS